MTRDAEVFYIEDRINYAIIKNKIEFDKNAQRLLALIAVYNHNNQYIFISSSNFLDDLIEDYMGIRASIADVYRTQFKHTKDNREFLFGNEVIASFIPDRLHTLSNIKIITALSKFDISNDNWQNPLQAREELRFNIFHADEPNKYGIEILGNIYFTNADTDFILDIDISSLAGFNSSNMPPTLEELYEVYRVAQDEWRSKIAGTAVNNGISISVVPKPAYFDNLKNSLQEISEKISAYRAGKN